MRPFGVRVIQVGSVCRVATFQSNSLEIFAGWLQSTNIICSVDSTALFGSNDVAVRHLGWISNQNRDGNIVVGVSTQRENLRKGRKNLPALCTKYDHVAFSLRASLGNFQRPPCWQVVIMAKHKNFKIYHILSSMGKEIFGLPYPLLLLCMLHNLNQSPVPKNSFFFSWTCTQQQCVQQLKHWIAGCVGKLEKYWAQFFENSLWNTHLNNGVEEKMGMWEGFSEFICQLDCVIRDVDVNQRTQIRMCCNPSMFWFQWCIRINYEIFVFSLVCRLSCMFFFFGKS